MHNRLVYNRQIMDGQPFCTKTRIGSGRGQLTHIGELFWARNNVSKQISEYWKKIRDKKNGRKLWNVLGTKVMKIVLLQKCELSNTGWYRWRSDTWTRLLMIGGSDWTKTRGVWVQNEKSRKWPQRLNEMSRRQNGWKDHFCKNADSSQKAA